MRSDPGCKIFFAQVARGELTLLKLREATDRAALVVAQQEQATRAAAVAALAEMIAREQGFAEATELPASPGFALWRAAAADRLAERHRAAADAEAACDAPQQALADTVRLRRGFETLRERAAETAARDAERRDPLRALMLLPRAR